MEQTKTSDLWASITASLFSKIDDEFLRSFRAPGGANARLAAWDPFDKSMRYYKFLLFNAARKKSRKFHSAYRKLGNTNLGNPISVSVSGSQVDIDYLFAVEEFLFLDSHMDLGGLKRIVEIGAGFGRTCHTLLSQVPTIKNYTIVDLPEVLSLSREYLARAIPDHYPKIDFVECNDTGRWHHLKTDLAINIDSFQEMKPAVIDEYMAFLISSSKSFYCKNPTGKYKPESVGLPALKPDELLDVFALGYCRNVFDLFDQKALSVARKHYLKSYQPPSQPKAGREWKLLADKATEMFPYFHHVLYQRV
jgi:putative sugar O-methyltransferase